MTTIFAVANQKGGVGKTTTAVTLGHGLSHRGYKTLIVDLDSQGNVADSLGLEAGGDLYRLLDPSGPTPLNKVVVQSGRENLDVIRSDKTTVRLKIALSGVDFKEMVLVEALGNTSYDVIIVDCPPSVDLFQTAALIAAKYLLVPTQLHQLSVKGIRDLLQSLVMLQKMQRSQCILAGIIPTFYDRSTSESHKQLVNLASSFKAKVWPPVCQDTKCREATRGGKTLWEYAPTCRAIRGFVNGDKQTLIGGYEQVVDRLLKLL